MRGRDAGAKNNRTDTNVNVDGKISGREENVDGKVCDIAEEASIPSAKVTDDVIEDLIDEFCSNEEYFKEVEESSDIFKLTHRCLPYDSGKSESEFQNEIRKNLTYTFNYYRVKSEDRDFRILKSEKSNETLKAYLKVKNVNEVLLSVKGLQTWKTDVRQMPKKISFHPSTLSK